MLRLILGLVLASATAGSLENPRPTMQRYGQNVGILLQNLEASPPEPSPGQKSKVLEALRILKAETHAIQPTINTYAVDPVMPYLFIDLSRQFARIEETYQAGDYGISRRILRETTQYCIGCHAASSNKGSAVPFFSDPDFNQSDLGRAEFLTATRRYEEALVAYEKVLSLPALKSNDPSRWEKAAMNLLALTIRIREDASMTLEMISALLDKAGYRPQQTDLLRVWRLSAKSWSLENRSASASPRETLLKAQNLLEKGKTLSSQRPYFGLVEMLRATMLLHSLGLSSASDAEKAESFHLMGQLNEEMEELYIWMRPDAYYEGCIRLQPHSQIARLCFDRLQPYSLHRMSAGMDAGHLQILRQLAQ